MRRLARLTLCFWLTTTSVWAQTGQKTVIYTNGIPYTTAIPTDCTNGMNYDGMVFTCAPVPGGLSSGTIILKLSGTCGTGFTEVSALNGKTLIGTVAANGDVGTTGGADTITPTVNSLTAAAQAFSGTPGTVPAQVFTGSSANTSAVSAGTPAGTNGTAAFTPAGTNGTAAFTPAGTNGTVTGPAQVISWPVGVPTFAGSALATHQHELPMQLVSNILTRFIASATFGVGASRAAIGQIATTANTTAAAVALSQAVSAGTPAGAVAWPAGVPTNGTSTIPAETFTGTPGTVPAQVFTGTPGTVPAQVFTGSALGTHLHALTATGTNGTAAFTPAGTNGTSNVTGTLNNFDNRSAFVKAIFCSAN